MPYGKTPHLRRSATGRVAKIAAISLLLVTAGCDTLGARFKAREGADAYHAGDFNAASMKFEQALKLDSDHPTLLLNAGTSNLALFRNIGGKTPEGQAAATKAISAYEQYLKKKPGDERVKAALIQTFVETSRYEDAVSFFRPVVDKNPPDMEALGILATVANKCGKNDEAQKWHQRKIDAQPNKADGYLSLGVFLWQELHDHPTDWNQDKRKEKGNLALERLKRAIELQPTAPNGYTYTNLVYRELSLSEMDQDEKRKDLEAAQKFFLMAQEHQKAGG